MLKYLVFGIGVYVAAKLTARYADSIWYCVMVAFGFFLFALYIHSPILMIWMVKEIIHTTAKGLKDELQS